MKGELLYVYDQRRWRIMWIIIYSLVLAGSVVGLYLFSNRIGTHSIPAGNVQLVIPYSKYLVDEPVTFTLYNRFNSTIYVMNQCPSEPLEVYRWTNNSWQRIHDRADLKDCIAENRQVRVPANGSASGTFAPWHHLFDRPGKYRVVAYVEYYNSLPYQDFEVIAKPAVPKVNRITRTNTGDSSGRSSSTTQPTSVRRSKTISTSGGSISVQYTSSMIYVISINPAPGYTYEGGSSGSDVEVTFKGATEIQIKLTLSGGQLQVRTEVGD